MIKRTVSIAIVLIALSAASLYSFNPDNRYFPFIPRAYITAPRQPSHLAMELFFTTAKNAFGYAQEDVGIPELYGEFDLSYLGNSLTAIGGMNPLPIDLIERRIPYKMQGKIQSQGFAFFYRQALHKYVCFGCHIFLMHVDSTISFLAPSVGSMDPFELEQDRLKILRDLGLSCGYSSQSGPGDIDLSVRVGNEWDYMFKFRHIQAGAGLGVLFPTGVRRNINNPVSVPFGGNGHWGIYVRGDAEFEVKEDIKVGFIAYASKRLPRVQNVRMPVVLEAEEGEVNDQNIALATGPYIFGAARGRARINPGVTFIFSPYLYAENIRDGLGGRIQYTLTDHFSDDWTIRHKCQNAPVDVLSIERVTPWASDYLSLSVFYDFGKLKFQRCMLPIVQLQWDIPTLFIAGKGVVRTQKVGLSVEFHF
jgi:hypothetical protein